MKTTLVLIAVVVAAWLTFGWFLMLEVGVAHRDWWHALPAMSFHVALIFAALAVLFGLLIGILQAAVKAA